MNHQFDSPRERASSFERSGQSGFLSRGELTKGLAQSVTRRAALKKFGVGLAGMALACFGLAIVTIPAQADRSGDRGHRGPLISAHGGTTFTLAAVEFDANGNPTKFSHTVSGVVRVSLLGNCTFQADIPAVPHPDGSFGLAGTFRITSADGETSLDAEVEGVVTPDPANPAFGNLHYDVKFTGGTGQMRDVRGGRAEMDGFGMFTSPGGGTATWLLDGHITTRGHGHGD